MKKIVVGIVVFVMGCLVIAQVSQASQTNLWILWGQSNMDQGPKPLPNAEWGEIPANVIYYVDDDWSTCGAECCYCDNNVKIGELKEYGNFSDQMHFGPEIGFAPSISKFYPNDLNVILRVVRSGTDMRIWQPNGVLYNLLLSHIQEVIAKYPGIIIMGVFECQGESDGKTEDLANAYFSRMTNMIRTLRSTLGYPTLPWFITVVNPPEVLFPYAYLVNQSQLALPAHIPSVRAVTNLWLTKYYQYDGQYHVAIHYNTLGQYRLGIWMVDAYQAFTLGK